MLKTVALDVIDNNANVKESLKKNSIQALKAAGRDVINQSGSGVQTKRSRKRKRTKSLKYRKTKRRKIVRKKTKKGKKRRRRKCVNNIFK